MWETTWRRGPDWPHALPSASAREKEMAYIFLLRPRWPNMTTRTQDLLHVHAFSTAVSFSRDPPPGGRMGLKTVLLKWSTAPPPPSRCEEVLGIINLSTFSDRCPNLPRQLSLKALLFLSLPASLPPFFCLSLPPAPFPTWLSSSHPSPHPPFYILSPSLSYIIVGALIEAVFSGLSILVINLFLPLSWLIYRKKRLYNWYFSIGCRLLQIGYSVSYAK